MAHVGIVATLTVDIGGPALTYPLLYEVWLSEGEPGSIVTINAVEEDGQKRLLASESFGPFDGHRDIAAWVWYHFSLDLERTKV